MTAAKKTIGFFRYFLLLVLMESFSTTAQVKIDTSLTAQYLVENDFLGSGIHISDVKHIGNPRGIGQFITDSSYFGMSSGIIMATGHILNARGPNISGGIGGIVTNVYQKTDKDLNRIAAGHSFDIVSIEFDFVPDNNKVSFRFSFASEEYKEYIGTHFNDVFAFMLEGENLKPVNLGVIPGTTTPVNVNSVNLQANGKLYIDNDYKGPSIKGLLKKAKGNSLQQEFEYDGFTRPMVASCFVTPYKKYHLKIVIGDVNDKAYDSAIFLEKGSFTSTRDTTQKGYVNYDNLPDFRYDTVLVHAVAKKKAPKYDPNRPAPEKLSISINSKPPAIMDTAYKELNKMAAVLVKNKQYNCEVAAYHAADDASINDWANKIINHLVSKGVKKTQIQFTGVKVNEVPSSTDRTIQVVLLKK